MKKRYILLLSLLFLVLSVSYVNASDNSTDIVKQHDTDVKSIDEQSRDTISANNDENDSVIAIDENDQPKQSLVYYVENVSSSENNNIIQLKSSDAVLTADSSSSSNTGTVYKEPTKKQRTFKIGNFKAVLSKKQYKKLFKASSTEDYFFDYGYNDYYYIGEKFNGYGISSTGLYCHITVKTNKFVKVKVKQGKKVKIKKSRVYMDFVYGAGQYGVAYRHMIYLSHKYDNPGYDSAKVLGKNAKLFSKCKTSASFTKLKKAKLISLNYAYKRYAVY